ncbi:MAG: tryptophan-rich sensory protein, partial [Spirochaetaceae bacterium]|nr:tryptophan-rich sensory protein [Spirochaetaceae bacterium]
YLVWTAPRGSGRLRPALGAYLLQLAVNFFWSIIFFSLERYLLAFGWLVLLWALIAITAVRFYRIRKAAGWHCGGLCRWYYLHLFSHRRISANL